MSEELVEILITGPGLPQDTIDKLKKRSDAENILFIGNGTDEVPLELITEKLQGKNIASIVRIDLIAHGSQQGQPKQHSIKLKQNTTITQAYFKTVLEALKGCLNGKEFTCEFHLWSCYAGAADKDTHVLGEGNTLITHVNSKNRALTPLDDYCMTKSIENYLENPNRSPLERFLKESKYSIQPTTFNLKISDPKAPIQFRSARYFKPNTFGSIIRLFQEKKDLVAVFKEVISTLILA